MTRTMRVSGVFSLWRRIVKSFTVLLLTQRFLEVSARAPIGENRLMVLALRVCQRRLLLKQVAEQDRLLGICFLLVPHLLDLGITDCLCDCKVRARFSELPKFRIHIKKNLFTCVLKGEFRLLLCKGGLSNLMTLLSPIPRLPGKQGANGAYVLRQKIDVCRTEVTRLNSDIRDVVCFLALGGQIGLTDTICRQLHFRTMFEGSTPGGRNILLLRERRWNGFYRKLRLHAAPQEVIQGIFAVCQCVFDRGQLITRLG